MNSQSQLFGPIVVSISPGTAYNRCKTRATFPSTTPTGEPKEIEATADAVYFPTPGRDINADRVEGIFPKHSLFEEDFEEDFEDDFEDDAEDFVEDVVNDAELDDEEDFVEDDAELEVLQKTSLFEDINESESSH